jgi:hypothetical protein
MRQAFLNIVTHDDRILKSKYSAKKIMNNKSRNATK